MATNPSRQASPTSEELCHRALRALQRLYCLTDADEPDLAANVTFTVGRVTLLRFAAANPWPVGGDAGAAAIAHIEAAERVNDPRTAEAWFTTFVDEVLGFLERRGRGGPHLGRRPSRRRGDRLEPVAAIGLAQRPRQDAAPALALRRS